MDLLEKVETERELINCHAIIQLQSEKIEELTRKVEHLEELLMFKAEILEFNKE